MEKLQQTGLNVNILAWVGNYLTSRKQMVVINLLMDQAPGLTTPILLPTLLNMSLSPFIMCQTSVSPLSLGKEG